MRTRLAEVLGTPTDAVSVKFTTTDRLGSIGRAEGIACWATVTVVRE
jgi:2-C-methyl-D-erythritol 2,4-cyclodiphosphate synthase